ncbi:MAG: hypothetical protein IJU86_02845 [Firmicutes bacterium]|nr:hypothetical protein [Bacillota bacterium]
MEENNNQSDNLIEIKTKSKIEIGENKLGKEKTKLSDWQMYQLAISSVAFVIETRKDLLSFALEKQKVGILCFLQFYSPDSSSSDFLLKKNYCYKNFFNGQDPFIRLWKNAHNNPSNCEKNEFIRDWLNKRQIIAKHLHRVFQIMIDYDYYCFTQGSSNLSLHCDALETTGNLNTIIKDFRRDGLNNHIDKKRIASRYQTLSFYDYDYFYKDEAPDETAVDFWLAMDRFLEQPYSTWKDIYERNPRLSGDEQDPKRLENANKKDKLRNYVHRIMIVPDEFLNNNEKNFRQWVRNSENQKKFITIYKNTFNKVPETGLKKIEDQKENIGSKLLFCKQEMTVTNLDGKQETKSVYSLKLLEDGKWVEYPEDKYAKYYKVTVYNSQRGGYDTKILDYELNDKEELYEFPNMEYLTYLLHADPKKLSKIEKEFVEAFLDRSAGGAFSLGVQMHEKNVKQYVHDNLITKRESWKLKESYLSDQDIKILNILNDDDRINEFNESVEEIYNADLVKNLWDTSQEELKAKDGINNFDAPTDEPEQYDIAKAMYKTLQICNAKEIKEKNILPEKVIIGKSKIIEKNSRDESYQITKNKSIITFDWSRFLKFLAVALLVSLVIFIALKFILDVVALWALIVFPVAPVIIFLVCVFFWRNKFKETAYLHKIKVPIHDNENQLNLQIDERNDRTANEPELVNQEKNTCKKDDKEYPGN